MVEADTYVTKVFKYMACTKHESFVSHSLLCLVANYKIKLWRAETLLDDVYKPIRNVQKTTVVRRKPRTCSISSPDRLQMFPHGY
jgi:hypothetical protein